MPPDASRDLLIHVDRFRRLLSLVVDQFGALRYPAEDDYAFMALCFLSKQVEHSHSIILLREHRDATLIARTMIEGVVQLQWARKARAKRGLQWRAFALISDWRLLQARRQPGEAHDPEMESNIERALQLHGDHFLTKKARDARTQGQPMPADPYFTTWRCGTSLRDIFAESDLRSVYKGHYDRISDWHHWGVTSLGAALRRQGNYVHYSPVSIEDAVTAIELAFHALLVTAQIAFGCLDHPIYPELETIEKEYLEWKRGHF